MTSFGRATQTLAAREPVVQALVERHGLPRLGPRPRVADRFEALARSIVFQQLAGAAASTIWGRVQAVLGGEVSAPALLGADPGALQGAGLSANKLAALTDLAGRTDDGRLDLTAMGRRSDDEVVAELIEVRGVGEWTAHMFLLFVLRRLDVWPTGDLGVRKGFAHLFELAAPPAPGDLFDLGARFSPYRSVLAWYCWREADTITPGR